MCCQVTGPMEMPGQKKALSTLPTPEYKDYPERRIVTSTVSVMLRQPILSVFCTRVELRGPKGGTVGGPKGNTNVDSGLRA